MQTKKTQWKSVQTSLVEANQAIAVLEAMKMETNIISTTDGIVDTVFVKEGQQVKAGEMIAVLK